MYLYIESLEWDSENIEHIARHHVTPDEVEEICHGLHIAKRAYEGRLLLIGPTLSGRMLGIVLAPKKRRRAYRPITARPARKDEIQLYDDESR